jgi:asparagine synthase (glutamine-hydrolysing)
VDEVATIARHFDAPNVDALIDRMLYADIRTRLPEHSLVLTDRLTMAHSLEARSPFLDHVLVEFVAKCPAKYKLRGRTLKYIQRRVAERYLPERIVRRPKQGFMFPIAFWMTGELAHPIDRLFGESCLVADGYLRGSALRRLVDEHRAHRVDHHVRIWLLLNLEVWYRMYVRGEPIASIREELMGWTHSEAAATAAG